MAQSKTEETLEDLDRTVGSDPRASEARGRRAHLSSRGPILTLFVIRFICIDAERQPCVM